MPSYEGINAISNYTMKQFNKKQIRISATNYYNYYYYIIQLIIDNRLRFNFNLDDFLQKMIYSILDTFVTEISVRISINSGGFYIIAISDEFLNSKSFVNFHKIV